MIYMVDSIQIAAEDTERYLEAFASVFLPPARRRGMELVACWHTPRDIGEDVTVMTVFRFRDWAHWDELRMKSVMDPALYDWIAIQTKLQKYGTRRFYQAAEFSPEFNP